MAAYDDMPKAGLVNLGNRYETTSLTHGAGRLDKYCRTTLNPFLATLTDAILRQRPANVEEFSLRFLQARASVQSAAGSTADDGINAALQRISGKRVAPKTSPGVAAPPPAKSRSAPAPHRATWSAGSSSTPGARRGRTAADEQFYRDLAGMHLNAIGKARQNSVTESSAGVSAEPQTDVGSTTTTAATALLPAFDWMQEGDMIEVDWEVEVNFNRSKNARFVRNSHLYRGRVQTVNTDGTFSIRYHDGDEEDQVNRAWVRWRRTLQRDLQASSGEGLAGADEIVAGSRVRCKCDGWQKAYEGRVMKVNTGGGSFRVQFNDGEVRVAVTRAEVVEKIG